MSLGSRAQPGRSVPITRLLTSHMLAGLVSQLFGPQKRRPAVTLRGSLENLESRALLSASGGVSLDVAADVQAVHVSEHGRRAVPRIDGVAGIINISDVRLGNGQLYILQGGQELAGHFDTPNLTFSTFTAQFKTARARVARGTVQFVFVGEELAENFKFTLRFKPNGDVTYKYR